MTAERTEALTALCAAAMDFAEKRAKYHAAWDARPPQWNEKRQASDLDATQIEAVKAVNVAREAMEKAAIAFVDDEPCRTCRAEIGHFLNCPHGCATGTMAGQPAPGGAP